MPRENIDAMIEKGAKKDEELSHSSKTIGRFSIQIIPLDSKDGKVYTVGYSENGPVSPGELAGSGRTVTDPEEAKDLFERACQLAEEGKNPKEVFNV